MKAIPHITLFILISFMSIGCAAQKDIHILDERLMILERQNQELQRQNSGVQKKISNELEKWGKTNQDSESQLRSKYAGINADLDTLRSNVQLLTGQIEESTHLVGVVQADNKAVQEKMNELSLSMAKLEQRMTEIERYLNFDQTSGKPSASKAGADHGKDTGVQQLYADAKQAYDNGQLDKARQGFQELLKNYPKSNSADNAQFWIGETYYREKWYEKAILEYQTVIDKYPKGNKVAAAMLKQGMAFLQINDKSAARLRFQELEKKYPKTNEAEIATKKLKEF